MTFIYHQQEIIGEKVQQTIGPLAGFTSVEITGVVLDATAMTQFFDHFHVIFYTFLKSMRLNGIADGFKESDTFHQVVLNLAYGTLLLFFSGHEEIGWIDLVVFKTG